MITLDTPDGWTLTGDAPDARRYHGPGRWIAVVEQVGTAGRRKQRSDARPGTVPGSQAAARVRWTVDCVPADGSGIVSLVELATGPEEALRQALGRHVAARVGT